TRPGKIVTRAKGGESAHNFGLAVDFMRAFGEALTEPDWLPTSYVTLGAVSMSHGLVWGGRFSSPDRPHVQWSGYVTAAELAPLKNWASKGMYSNDMDWLKSVWSQVDLGRKNVA